VTIRYYQPCKLDAAEFTLGQRFINTRFWCRRRNSYDGPDPHLGANEIGQEVDNNNETSHDQAIILILQALQQQ